MLYILILLLFHLTYSVCATSGHFQSTAWHKYNGSCFLALYKTTGFNWSDSEEICGSLTPSSHLTSIHSQEELHFIRKILPNGSTFWTGLRLQHTSGLYVWSDGSPYDFELVIGKAADVKECVTMKIFGETFNRQACSQKRSIVCKKPGDAKHGSCDTHSTSTTQPLAGLTTTTPMAPNTTLPNVSTAKISTTSESLVSQDPSSDVTTTLSSTVTETPITTTAANKAQTISSNGMETVSSTVTATTGVLAAENTALIAENTTTAISTSPPPSTTATHNPNTFVPITTSKISTGALSEITAGTLTRTPFMKATLPITSHVGFATTPADPQHKLKDEILELINITNDKSRENIVDVVVVLVMMSMEVFSDFVADSYTNDTDLMIQLPTVEMALIPICATCNQQSNVSESVEVNLSLVSVSIPSAALNYKDASVSLVVVNNITTEGPVKFDNDSSNEDIHLASKIATLSAALWDDGDLAISVENPVTLQFIHNEPIEDGFERLCSFWKYSDESNMTEGVWSAEGCYFEASQSDPLVTTCKCSHLTNFAVLIRLRRSLPLPIRHEKTLEMLSIVGGSLSVICLTLTLCVYLVLGMFGSERVIVHGNLALSLLVSQLVFLCGIENENPTACKAVAILLHFFLVASFSWMLVEGVLLYLKAGRIFFKEIKLVWLMLMGWSPPIVIISICVGLKLEGYGTREVCWLSIEDGLIWAFVGPVVFVSVVNVIILITVLRTFLGLKANKDKSETRKLKSVARAILVMQPIMGLTWLFGIFALDAVELLFSYLFVVLNSSQGVFIFILHCLCSDEFKRVMKRRWKRVGTYFDSDSISMSQHPSHGTSRNKSKCLTKTSGAQSKSPESASREGASSAWT